MFYLIIHNRNMGYQDLKRNKANLVLYSPSTIEAFGASNRTYSMQNLIMTDQVISVQSLVTSLHRFELHLPYSRRPMNTDSTFSYFEVQRLKYNANF